jgi:hypothetical protein
MNGFGRSGRLVILVESQIQMCSALEVRGRPQETERFLTSLPDSFMRSAYSIIDTRIERQC